jgi:hypothetical protein
VTIDDIGPDSRYENGDPWMRLDVEEATEQGFLRPALELKPIPKEKEDDFNKEFLFEKEPEVYTRGHLSEDEETNKRITKMTERAEFSNYENLLPTKRPFPVMVRITGYVMCFISKCLRKVNIRRGTNKIWTGNLLAEATIWFSAFPVTTMNNDLDSHKMQLWVHLAEDEQETENSCDLVSCLSEGLDMSSSATFYMAHTIGDVDTPGSLTDSFLNAALMYYFRVASKEVIEFNSKQVIERRTIIKDGVLLSKGRIIDGMHFIETADLDTINLDNLCIKTMIPVIDRYSPLAYSIAQHFHWKVAKHKGMETCLRLSLEHVHILQGMSLFRELNDECIR